MPSNTPLPAKTLLALADELLDYVDGGAFDSCCCDSDYANRGSKAAEAYRAARAASPVTLEEALMDHLIAVERSNDTEDRIAAMGAIITHGRTINARRLAGEGGAA